MRDRILPIRTHKICLRSCHYTGRTSMLNPQSQRVLHKRPEFMRFIKDEKTVEILKDQNHYPILKILKKESMTVKELEKAYGEETNKRKSNKTIYRYLKTLEDANLVIPAGQLVTTGKTATETIYARSAMAFYLVGEAGTWCEGERGKRIMTGIEKMLGPLFNNKEVSVEKLSQLIGLYEKQKLSEMEKLAEVVGDGMSEIIEEFDFKDIGHILEFSSFIAGLKANQDILERVESCFH